MEGTKLVKGYESKIILISNELEHIRNEKEELAEEHERVKKLLLDSNNQLQLKDKELAAKQKAFAALKKQKEQLESIVQKSQRHRKVLFDHLFSDRGEEAVVEVARRNSMMMQLSTISSEFNQSNFASMQKIITERNNEVKKISTKYSDLMRDHLKSTCEYQEMVRKLKEENKILQRSINIQLEVQKKLEQMHPKKCEELKNKVKGCEQKMLLMAQKIKMDEETIRKLSKDLKQKSQWKTRAQSEPPVMPQLEQYLATVKLNKQLKKEIKQISYKYQVLTQQYPNLMQSEQDLVNLMEKQKEIHKYELEGEKKNAKITALEQELQKTKEDCSKYIAELNQKRTLYQTNQRRYKEIVMRLRDFFILVNPHYQAYNFEQLNLTKEQQELLKKANSQQTSLKTELAECKQKMNKLGNLVESKSTQLAKLNEVLQKQNKKVSELQSINQMLQKGFKEKSNKLVVDNEIKYINSILKVFVKLQQERDDLMLQLKEEEIKNVESKLEMAKLLKNQALDCHQSLEDKSFKYPEINVARPSIVYLEFTKDFSNINTKLLELQEKIEQAYRDHELVIKQLKAEHLCQTNNLKEKILKLEGEKKELADQNAALVSASVHSDQVQQSAHPNLQVQLQSFNNQQSMMEIEDQFIEGGGVDQPLNTLTPESIEEMGKVFKGHEVNLKNIMQAYADLKTKLQGMEAIRDRVTNQPEVEQMKAKIQEYASQINAMKIRLREADKNLVMVEEQLASKNAEIQNLRASFTTEVDHLKKIIQTLEEQSEELRKQDWLQSPSPLPKNTSKKCFPEQIEYLVELVQEQKQRLKSSHQQPVQVERKVVQEVSKNSKEWEEAQSQGLRELVTNGKLLAVLEEAIKKLNQKIE